MAFPSFIKIFNPPSFSILDYIVRQYALIIHALRINLIEILQKGIFYINKIWEKCTPINSKLYT